MFSLPYLCICIYCMLQLSFLIITDKRHRNVSFNQERYFSLTLIIMLFSFAADIVSSFNTSNDFLYPFVMAGNYFEIILNTILLPIYFLYVCSQISNIDVVLKKKIYYLILMLAGICSTVVISTAFSRQVFYFDGNRIYHRGQLFWIPMSILLVMMIIIQGFIIMQKSKIEARYFRALVFFLIMPIFGWGLQFLIYGLPFSLICATFAAQVVFTNIQNRTMSTDYLTGVFNRKELDNYMQYKIDTSKDNQSFSAILIDIDNFKSINDRFGHREGDIALANTVSVLREAVQGKEFIARYGGDEFCVIIDSDDTSDLEMAIQSIKFRLLCFNENSNKPYKLDFSMGHSVYTTSMGERKELFLNTIDKKMYDEKKVRKEASKNHIR